MCFSLIFITLDTCGVIDFFFSKIYTHDFVNTITEIFLHLIARVCKS